MCAIEQIIMSAPLLTAAASQVAVEATPFIDGLKNMVKRAVDPMVSAVKAVGAALHVGPMVAIRVPPSL